ncbi:SMP-30/gluconolactonase/LRE family protein [Methylobacterium sp. J-070]|uniref:SMP-30/gluconolactonase/LRE family protein n=1 Tax=Methylobacterium sp. J-070 TaxID=2836650 RepID=UPI001FB86204|nr:major royal jelly family protein [Methylobacterium sp. J-070]MCJ2050121.1 major royal jelly family protein [Methylobacterium sp. J-070]
MFLHRRRLIGSGLLALAARGAQAAPSPAPQPPVTRPVGPLELAIAAAAPSTPTGLAIAGNGRMFVMMPRFTGAEPVTLGEVMPDGTVKPYPDAEANRPDRSAPQASLFHVPNAVFDRDDTLWVLDAGLPDGKGTPVPGGAKIVAIDIAQDRIRRSIPLGAGVMPHSSLNDLRVDRRDGRALAYITDQGQTGQGAILVVDLDGGRVVRRLADHASTRSEDGLVKFVERRPVMERRKEDAGDAPPKSPKGGANGIALSPDGARLYYAPLMSRRLYAVETAALRDPNASEADVAASVRDLGEKGMTGGLIADSRDRVYLSLQEHNAVGRRLPDGTIEVIAADDRLIWADTFWITPDRWLYISAAQVNRRPEYNGGQDLQQPPYAILRMRIDADPVI